MPCVVVDVRVMRSDKKGGRIREKQAGGGYSELGAGKYTRPSVPVYKTRPLRQDSRCIL